jgi:hypothetical protein
MDDLVKMFGSTSLGQKPASPRRNNTRGNNKSTKGNNKNTRKSTTRGFGMQNVRRLSMGRALTASQKARLKVTRPSVAKAIRNARSGTKRNNRSVFSLRGRTGVAEKVFKKRPGFRAKTVKGVKGVRAAPMGMNLERVRRRRATVAPRDEVTVDIPAGMTAFEGVLGNKTFRDRLGELHDEGYTRVVREGRRGGHVVLGK